MKYAWTIYVPICDGINGDIGSLSIDENHTDDSYTLPIDTLVVDIEKNSDIDIDIGHVESV